MSIGTGVVIWLDQNRRVYAEVEEFDCRGHIITRGFGCSQVITRGYFFADVVFISLITRGYGARNVITRGMG